MLYSRTLLFIHPMYNSLHLLIPKSYSIPPPPHPPWQPQVCSLCLWVCFSFVDKFIYIIFLDSTYKWYMIFVFLRLTSLSMIISKFIKYFLMETPKNSVQKLGERGQHPHIVAYNWAQNCPPRRTGRWHGQLRTGFLQLHLTPLPLNRAFAQLLTKF